MPPELPSRTRFAALTSNLYVAELFFFTVVLPLTVVISAVEIAVGLLSLLTVPFVGARAYRPWQRLRALWALVWRHLRYVFSYAFVPQVRGDLEAAQRAAKDKIDALKERVPEIPDLPALQADAIDLEVLLITLVAMLPAAVVGTHVLIAVVVVLSTWTVARTTYGVAELPAEPTTPVEVAYEPQIADKQEADYGPWFQRGEVFSEVAEPDFLNLALLSDDGSAQYSQRVVGLPDGFEARAVHDRVRHAKLEATGQVVFRDPHNNRFAVNPGQVFLFENYKSEAFTFDDAGKLQAIGAAELRIEEIP